MMLRNGRKRVRRIVELSDETSRDSVDEFEPDGSENESSDTPEPRTTHKNINIKAKRRGSNLKQNHKAETCPKPSKQPSDESWSRKYAEKCSSLAPGISNKKNKDLNQWLKNALNGKGTRLLVLGGPPGCGKTFAVRRICHQLGCTIREWSAPVVNTSGILRSLVSDFQAFVVGTQYQGLHSEETEEFNDRANHVVLIKDFPVYITDSSQHTQDLRKIFETITKSARHPTILVLSDTDKGIAQMARHLIGLDLLDSPLVETIKVNPVSDAMMKRRLTDIATMERLSISDSAYESIVASSQGDIRSAVNTLQFATSSGSYQNDGEVKGSKKGRKSKRQRRAHGIPVAFIDEIGRDTTLSTYHAIAKVLNNKREKDGTSLYSPERILHDSGTDPSSFMSFLHQNYLSFFGDVSDVHPALKCLSDADVLLPWRQDEKTWRELSECAASVTIRGFLEYNKRPVRTGWRPIHGSSSYAISNERQEYVADAHRNFQNKINPTVYHSSHICETFAYAELISKRKVKQWSFDSIQTNQFTNSLMTASKFIRNDSTAANTSFISRRQVQPVQKEQWTENTDENMEDIEDWDDED